VGALFNCIRKPPAMQVCSEKLKRCKKIPHFDKIEMVSSANLKNQRRYCPNGQ